MFQQRFHINIVSEVRQAPARYRCLFCNQKTALFFGNVKHESCKLRYKKIMKYCNISRFTKKKID